jgi:hypothetical protein
MWSCPETNRGRLNRAPHNKALQLTADGLTETVVLCRIDQLTSTHAARQLSLMLHGFTWRIGCTIGEMCMMAKMGGTGNTSKPSTATLYRCPPPKRRRGTALKSPSKLSTATAVRCPPSPLKTGAIKLCTNSFEVRLGEDRSVRLKEEPCNKSLQLSPRIQPHSAH